MKKLLLMRHAKSSWSDTTLADFDRPLNDRGRKAAPFMGSVIAERGLRPELILSSPAVRAADTAEAVRRNAGVEAEIRFDERIYEASPQMLRQVVEELDPALSTVLLVGHNPGIEGFLRFLTGEIRPMPTAALAVIEFSSDSWANASGRLVQLIRPKDEMKMFGSHS